MIDPGVLGSTCISPVSFRDAIWAYDIDLIQRISGMPLETSIFRRGAPRHRVTTMKPIMSPYVYRFKLLEEENDLKQ